MVSCFIAWARVIHRSKFGEGIAVRDLAGMTNTSPGILPGLKMLFGRMRERGADRSVRASYECDFVILSPN